MVKGKLLFILEDMAYDVILTAKQLLKTIKLVAFLVELSMLTGNFHNSVVLKNLSRMQ